MKKEKKTKTSVVDKTDVINEKGSSKYSSLVIILVFAFIVVALTWFFKSGLFNEAGNIDVINGHISLVDYVLGFGTAFSTFLYEFLFILSVGGFYAIISKAKSYQDILNNLGGLISRNKVSSIFTISLIFALLSAIFTNVLFTVVLLPFAISILSRAKINKYVVFSTTFGSVLLGMLGPLFTGYGFDDIYYAINSASSELLANPASYLIYNVAILVLGYVILNCYSVMKLKNETILVDKYECSDVTEEVSLTPVFVTIGILVSLFLGFIVSSFVSTNAFFILCGIGVFVFVGLVILLMFKFRDISNKTWPLVLLLGIILFVTLLGFINWGSMLDTNLFLDFHEYVINDLFIETNGQTNKLFSNMIGSTASVLGGWSGVISLVFILIVTFVTAKTLKMKFAESLDTFAHGVRIIFYPALLFLFAHVIDIFTSWVPTINLISLELMNLSPDYNVFIFILIGMLCAFFTSNPAFVAHLFAVVLTVKFTFDAASAGFVINTLFGYMQFIVPSGLLLLFGLEYCNIKYFEWLKYAWKLFIGLFIVVVLILIFM